MDDQDTQATQPAPREDNRNEEVEGSPAPDPTDGQGDADDVPEAD